MNHHTPIRQGEDPEAEAFNAALYERKNRSQAFTLIELLVVITIIAILAAILFPVFGQAKESAKKGVCLSNTKQISLAFTMYVSDYDDMTPPLVYSNWDAQEGMNAAMFPLFRQWSAPLYKISGEGMLWPYIKSLEVTGCPGGRDLPNYYASTSSGILYQNYHQIVGLLSIGYSQSLDRQNLSEWEAPAGNILLTDSAQPDMWKPSANPRWGLPEGVPFIINTRSAATAGGTMVHGRHVGGAANVGWMDGHAKSMRVHVPDWDPSNAAGRTGYTRDYFIRHKLGVLLPPGLTPTAGTSPVNGTHVLNDPKSNNYFNKIQVK